MRLRGRDALGAGRAAPIFAFACSVLFRSIALTSAPRRRSRGSSPARQVSVKSMSSAIQPFHRALSWILLAAIPLAILSAPVAAQGNSAPDAVDDLFERDQGYAAETDDFVVNNTTTGNENSPDIAVLANGNLVIVYQASNGNDAQILGRIFTVSGTALSSEILVNSSSTGIYTNPVVAALADGGFVVAYEDRNGTDGDGSGIIAQRFDSNGSPFGSHLIVNTTTIGSQRAPSITALTGGGFVVTFEATDANGVHGGSILARQFDSSGNANGPDFAVNTLTAGNRRDPEVAALSDGGFIIVYGDETGSDGDGYGISARRFDASGGGQLATSSSLILRLMALKPNRPSLD